MRTGVFALAVVCSALTMGSAAAATISARELYRDGRKAEQRGQMAEAYALYSRAAALEPNNTLYWLRSQAVQTRAAMEAKIRPPESGARPASAGSSMTPIEAGLEKASPKESAAEALPPPTLHGSTGLRDFNLRADSKALFEQVSHAFGLDVVFDGDYQPGAPISFRVEQTDWRESLEMLEAATSSFIVPLSGKLFLVAKDTEQKRREMEPTMAVTIPVPQAVATQELVEIAQAVRQLFTLEHVAWDSQQNRVVLRDRVSRVIPARKVFEELLHHRPQVVMELEMIEVDRNQTMTYGLQLPTQFPLIYLGGFFWGMAPDIPSTITGLLGFGGRKGLFGIGVGGAQVFATLARSGAHTLLKADIRSIDGQPATFHVGQRYPILTAGYFGPASFTNGQQAYTPPPSFTFEDLGISIKVTPRIHDAEEVTLDLETEFKVLSGSSLNGIPVISNRKLTGKVRLRDGEYGFVAGLLSTTEAHGIQGIVGLESIPGLGPLFSKNTSERDSQEVLIVVKPRIINLPASESVSVAQRVGSETRPFSPL